MAAIDNYYAALQRLTDNQPQVLKKGQYSITQDAVCLEAGNKKGSIKPSRGEVWQRLIADIKLAAEQYTSPLTPLQRAKNKAENSNRKAIDYRERYHAALNREAILLGRLRELEQRLLALDPEVITELRPGVSESQTDQELD